VYGELPRDIADVCGELQLPLHVFAWQPEMQRRGLQRSALYLIRPDGYVALADPHADPKRLRDYVAAPAWRPHSAGRESGSSRRA
jgi:hypothetical protein